VPTVDTWSPVASSILNNVSGLKKTWVRTPNFGSLAKNAKPVNPYLWQYRSASQTRVTQYYQPPGGPPAYSYNNALLWDGYTIDQTWYTHYINNAHPAAWSGIENQVQLKVLGKISDAKVNVAVAFAEARKTSDLILNTANRIDRAYRAFKRGHLRKVAKILNITPGTVHKSWLEYKYGWMPLLMDVKGAAEFFAQQHVTRNPRFAVSSHQDRSFQTSRSVGYYAMGNHGDLSYYTETCKSTWKYKVKAWCEITTPHAAELQQLGLTNPALIAWELIPFSFVFDWFISVGDYLQGLTALNGVSVYRCMQSHELESTFSLVYPYTEYNNSGYLYVTSSFSMSFRVREYMRDPLVLDPLSLYPPRTNSFGFTKLVTSLALLRGQYRGHGGL